MSFGQNEVLRTNAKIPVVGYGTWQAAPGETAMGVELAMKAGYRHIDAAKVYKNQVEFGEGFKKGLKETNTKREDYFITSKLWNTHHKPELVAAALEDTLKELDLDYLDLFLIHWPVEFAVPEGNQLFKESHPKSASNPKLPDVRFDTPLTETWKAMTQLPKDKVRAVGVSNFTKEHIEALIHYTDIVPAVNQIERHPRLLQFDLLDYCKKQKIHVTAYSTLGNNLIGVPLLTEEEVVKEIAKEKNATTGQVLLAWGLHGGNLSVLTKSVTPQRIIDNFKQIELSDEQVKRINAIGEKNPRRFNIPATYPIEEPFWEVNVWDYEEEKKYPSVRVK